MQSGTYDENMERNSEPLYDKKHLLFSIEEYSCWMYLIQIVNKAGN
jgi:hypothetical protein